MEWKGEALRREAVEPRARRREMMAKAGVVTVAAFVATLAFGATFGLADRTEPDSPVGRLDESRGAVARATGSTAVSTGQAVSTPVTTTPITAPRLGPQADD